MKHTVVRRLLAVLLAAVAVFDIAEGVLVLTGVCVPPAEYRGTLFIDATVPMLLVTIVVGGSSLLAAVLVLARHAWGVFLAAAAGLLMIAWEIADVVVAQHFWSIFVAVGLAVIALAEYLWATELRGERRAQSYHAGVRIALLALETFIVVGAIDGGMALLRGAFDQVVSVDWLAGTPFSDYTLPALVLVIVVGGSALLAAATVFIDREWAVLLSVLAGLVMAGFLVVEAISLDSKVGDALPIVLVMQILYFVPGLAIVGLAGSLWMREYRAHHVHVRPA